MITPEAMLKMESALYLAAFHYALKNQSINSVWVAEWFIANLASLPGPVLAEMRQFLQIAKQRHESPKFSSPFGSYDRVWLDLLSRLERQSAANDVTEARATGSGRTLPRKD